MKLLKNLVYATSMMLMFSATAQTPPMTAVETAQKGVQELLQTVTQAKPYFVSDRDRYFSEVESVLVSFVDFNEVATVVMSRFGDTATEAQKQRFADILKQTLTRFYGATLAAYDGQELVFVPSPNTPSDPRADQVVGMEMRDTDNTAIKIQYQMFLNENDEWKLKNLSLSGINLGRQYYTQFAASMGQYNNDIDQVLDNWK